jgi:hypothetical protein
VADADPLWSGGVIMLALLQVFTVPAPPSPFPEWVDRRFECKVLTRSDEIAKVKGTLKRDKEFKNWVEYTVSSKTLPTRSGPVRASFQSIANWRVELPGRDFLFSLTLPGKINNEGSLNVSLKSEREIVPRNFAIGFCNVDRIIKDVK